MNDKKICFIMCVNNEDYMEEQVAYLNHLQVPEGYEIDVLNVYGATSMTSGYNEAMHASDAKYRYIVSISESKRYSYIRLAKRESRLGVSHNGIPIF